jgi:hypothetical protein
MTNLYFPCPTCNGVEGCDHTEPERKEAYTRLKFYASLGIALISSGTYDRMNDLDGPEDAKHLVEKFVKECEPILDTEHERRRLNTIERFKRTGYAK